MKDIEQVIELRMRGSVFIRCVYIEAPVTRRPFDKVSRVAVLYVCMDIEDAYKIYTFLCWEIVLAVF